VGLSHAIPQESVAPYRACRIGFPYVYVGSSGERSVYEGTH
jgi:hypothetical protein